MNKGLPDGGVQKACYTVSTFWRFSESNVSRIRVLHTTIQPLTLSDGTPVAPLARVWGVHEVAVKLCHVVSTLNKVPGIYNAFRANAGIIPSNQPSALSPESFPFDYCFTFHPI